MRHHFQKITFAAAIALAITLTFTACGEHTWQDAWDCSKSDDKDIFDCSLDVIEDVIEDVVKDILTDNEDSIGEGDAPPNDTSPSSSGSQGPAIVGPLLKTQWGSGSPFNPFYALPDGQTGWMLCDNVATAQIMKYYNHPKRGVGQSKPCEPCTFYEGQKVVMPSVSFEVDYDWGNMLDSYRNVNLTDPQRNAILTLLHRVELGGAFVANFGYDKTIETHYPRYYNDADWAAMIRKQLDAGLPVKYSGRNNTGDPSRGTSHAFIIDGYDNTGKFHVNWGWGGNHDGYYSLNALNPGTRDYNSENGARINIQPDKGSIGSNTIALDSFTVGKTSVSQYELFNIKAKIHRLAWFPVGQLGAALVDNKGSIAKVLGIKSSATNYNMDVFIPEDVNPGQYTLRIASRLEGGKWEITTLSDRTANIPSAINITVKAAELGASGDGYGLALETFTPSRTAVSQNESFTVESKLKNVSPTDTFPSGDLGVALVDNRNNIAAVVGTFRHTSTRAPGQAYVLKTIDCVVPDTVKPGQYKLRTLVKPIGSDEWHVATMSVGDVPSAIDFTVKPAEPGAPGGGYGLALETFTPSKTTVAQNEAFTVQSKLKNVSQTDTFPSGYLGVALVDGGNNIVAVVGTFRHTATRAPGEAYVLKTIDCVVPDTVKPGQYKLRTLVKPIDSDEWRVATMSVGNVPTAIDFTVK